MDEVFELATLIQTGKVEDFPVVLMGRDYWEPLLDFVENSLIAEGTIEPTDLRLIQRADTPEEAVRIISELG